MIKQMIDFAQNNSNGFVAIAALAAVVMTALTALISFIGLIYQKIMDLKSQELDAVRKLVDDNIQLLGESAYVVLAQSTILVKRFIRTKADSPQAFLDTTNKVKEKIGNAKQVLIKSRISNRYVLIGVEDAFQKIARIGDWIKNCEHNIPVAEQLIKKGTKLRKIADNAIIRMYRYGKMPSKLTVLRIKYHCWKTDCIWNKCRDEYLNGED